jgi:starvation-inducible DNA-binding protein
MALQMQEKPVNIGMDEGQRREIADRLSTFLANTYSLYIQSQNYHWNVTGPNFQQYHALFEQQYTELATALDEIAERIRAIGFRAPASLAQFTRFCTLNEQDQAERAEQMVQALIQNHEQVTREGREMMGFLESTGDVVTADLITERMAYHEKTAWMLRSHLS